MSSFAVIGGPQSKKLAKNIAKRLGASYIPTNVKIFHDGESKITITIKKKFDNIIVVQSTYPPVDTSIIHALSILSKAHEISHNVYLVIPYVGYAKQDKEFLKGEIITIKVIAELFHSVKCSEIIMVDFHSSEALSFFHMPTKNISAVELLADHVKKLNLSHPLIVSPDLFWKVHAKKFANIIGSDSIALNKKRDRKSGELSIISKKFQTSKKRDLIILDDMVSTGNSVREAIKFLGRNNFGKIIVACTHPVLVKNAEKMLMKNGVSRIIGTNSIDGKFAKIDLSQIIVDAIKQ